MKHGSVLVSRRWWACVHGRTGTEINSRESKHRHWLFSHTSVLICYISSGCVVWNHQRERLPLQKRGGRETEGGSKEGRRNPKLLRRRTATKLPVYVTHPGLWKTVRLEFCLILSLHMPPRQVYLKPLASRLLIRNMKIIIHSLFGGLTKHIHKACDLGLPCILCSFVCPAPILKLHCRGKVTHFSNKEIQLC